ncbi:hypothetical protein CMQ_410 [Grosmannia clavigera kw1407]|uniref:Nephrocystin 3-like N-terminal domain-containing protein n=1 Tax=Grosmannia clavigera (strain kw1407 / UAMH 11150) TaxID=655863 RepID=F0XEL5_GROCL|nr:uncharacterized protein CMQ_410 [Grosmannia clavigera kw1407]EFX03482.1 hypothetical protein CMQ_410 [Grosmannia clavigera kw1407]
MQRQRRLIYLVFIHGIQGHPHKTWATPSVDPSKTTGRNVLSLLNRRSKQVGSDGCLTVVADSVFWPKDFLAADCRNARILTYGYDSRVTHFFGGAPNQNNISAHGRSLLNALERNRRESPKRPVIFIVHSLGGIVLKEALRRSKAARLEDQDLRDMYECTYAIVFFGTPHRGSSYAKIGLVAERIVKTVGFAANDKLLRDLKPDGTHLEILREDFSTMLEDRAFKVYSFQEGQGLYVVDDASSSLDSQMERKDHINANHMMMCRFLSREDEGYIKCHGVIAKYVQEIERGAEATQQELDEKQKALRELILQSLSTAAMEDRHRQIESAHSDTFDWIFTGPNAGFKSWAESDHGIFWIKGKPGSGKSTLIKYILNDPRTLQYLSSRDRKVLSMPSFFFHDRGEDMQKSFDGLLRSVLYQLVYNIPALTHTISKFYYQQMERSGVCTWPAPELESSLQAVLAQQSVQGCVCLFVDALDEFKGRKDKITRFLKALAAPKSGQRLTIRICASGRDWNEFLMLSDNPHIRLQDWTVGDIQSFAQDRLAEARREDTNLLLKEITERAEGVFLWVKLVVDELWEPLINGLPISDLVALMGDLPDELPLFYERILSNIPQRDHAMSLCMFELVLSPLSHRLSLSDFSLAVELIHSTSTLPQDVDLESAGDRKRCDLVQRRVRACSGGLLDVTLMTSVLQVQFIHQTAQSFVRDAENRAWFDGKSASDLALAGAERIMRLVVQLLGHTDKTPQLSYFRHWSLSTLELLKSNLHSSLISEFVDQALGCQNISRLPSQAVMDEFRDSIAEHCGPKWLETYWSIATKHDWIYFFQTIFNSLVPALFLEFMVISGLLQVAERELTQNQSRGLTNAESTRLCPRGTVSLNIANDVGRLMTQFRLPHPPRSSDRDSSSSTRVSGKSAVIMVDITPLHMALAVACTYDADNVLGRIFKVEMVRILVECGADATAKYQNVWSAPRDHTERTAVHYLLYKDPDEKNPFDDRDLGDALSKCIVSFFDHGLDPNAVDSNGKSILEYAIPWCPASLIEILLQRGAKITPGLLTETGELIPAASDILRKPEWRRPEFYTPEANRLVQKHNPAWEQDSPMGLVQGVGTFSFAARAVAGLAASFWNF